MPSFSASRAAWSGAPPPKAISGAVLPAPCRARRRGRGRHWPCSPSTISLDAEGRERRVDRPSGVADCRVDGAAWPRRASSLIEPPAKSSGSMRPSTTSASVTAGCRAAAAVARRAGLGAGALRPDGDALQRIDARRSSRRPRRSRPSRSPGCAPAGRCPSGSGAARSTSKLRESCGLPSSIRQILAVVPPMSKRAARCSTAALPRPAPSKDRAAGRARFDEADREARAPSRGR